MADHLFQERLTAALDDVSQTTVAGELGVSPQTVSDWKRGHRAPGPHHVFALERALRLAPGELSQHLGYVPVEARQRTRQETEAHVSRTRRHVRQLAGDLDVPVGDLVDDVDGFTREAAELGLEIALGRLAVRGYEDQHGSLTEEELARADDELAAAETATTAANRVA